MKKVALVCLSWTIKIGWREHIWLISGCWYHSRIVSSPNIGNMQKRPLVLVFINKAQTAAKTDGLAFQQPVLRWPTPNILLLVDMGLLVGFLWSWFVWACRDPCPPPEKIWPSQMYVYKYIWSLVPFKPCIFHIFPYNLNNHKLHRLWCQFFPEPSDDQIFLWVAALVNY